MLSLTCSCCGGEIKPEEKMAFTLVGDEKEVHLGKNEGYGTVLHSLDLEASYVVSNEFSDHLDYLFDDFEADEIVLCNPICMSCCR
jgi:hypothetical protein